MHPLIKSSGSKCKINFCHITSNCDIANTSTRFRGKILHGNSFITTTDVNIKLAKTQDGVSVYETTRNPIKYSSNPQLITKHHVEGISAYTLKNVLNTDECQQFIQVAENMGYEEAKVTTSGGMLMRKDVRDNLRVLWQARPEVLEPIWNRIKNHLDQQVVVAGTTWNISSLNDRLRIYKYEPGQVFKKHYDGFFKRNLHERSFATILIYLTDGFQGGHTTFFKGGRSVSVSPEKGSALVFFHGQHPESPLHEGSACEDGIKYVFRSDVMYKDEIQPTKEENFAS